MCSVKIAFEELLSAHIITILGCAMNELTTQEHADPPRQSCQNQKRKVISLQDVLLTSFSVPLELQVSQFLSAEDDSSFGDPFKRL